jgi:uncharacterized membrane protein YeaQ/YmgE (transglycosylase-associated protein family)
VARQKTFDALKRKGSDVVGLVIDYFKQETIGPLRSLGRFVAFGTVGSIFLGIGFILLLVSLLRLLQEETATFQGNLSWIPYLIVAVVGVMIIILAAWRVVSGPAKRRLPKPGGEK